MVDDYALDKDKDKIKEIIGVEKFYDTKTLVDIDHKLPDNNILKKVVILMACVIKDDDKLSLELFLEEALFPR